MKSASCGCEHIDGQIEAYLERRLPSSQAAAFEAHLNVCEACSKSVHYSRAVLGLVDYVQARRTAPVPATVNNAVETEQEQKTVHFLDRLGAAPWWFVSCALHMLVISLLTLVSMAIELPRNDDAVIMITELQARNSLPKEETPPRADQAEVLAQRDTPATDPNAPNASAITVPPDILAQAELGDHFETVNPELPDTHDAYGNPDSRSFHAMEGNAEAAGGGGMGGLGNDDLIGFGGAASKGSGGGFGGGDGTGIGTGTGGGGGTFGTRTGAGRKLMVMRHGGSKATESSVDKALEWLAYHQEADGHWDSVKFKASSCVDTAMTSLALLAFLGAGHTEKVGGYKDNVVRAVAWLKSVQLPDGSVCKERADGRDLGYSTAMATMALAEAAGMSKVPETREAAQRAVDYCTERHQNGEGSEKMAWRYAAKSPDEDISNSGWFVMALKSAKVAGLHVNHASFEGAMKYIDKLEIKAPAAPDNGYGPASRYGYQPNLIPFPHRESAIGVLCRLFLGYDREKLQSSAELFVTEGGTPGTPPKARPQAEEDLYYWYYGTLCAFQIGGDLWTRWNDDMKKFLPQTQCKNGDDTGSWDPAGAYSDRWGRVGQTALSALCMEVYYRYVQLSRH